MRRATKQKSQRTFRAGSRRGLATMDYLLLMGVVLPLATFLWWIAPNIINLVYQMTSVLVSWPFM